ncbi:MAG: hypothetical protein ABIH49_03495 [archaeon]
MNKKAYVEKNYRYSKSNKGYQSMIGSLKDLIKLLRESNIYLDSESVRQAEWMSWHARNLESRNLAGRAFYEGDNPSNILPRSTILTYEQGGTLLKGVWDSEVFSIYLKKSGNGVAYSVSSSDEQTSRNLKAIIQGFYISRDFETAKGDIRKLIRLNHQKESESPENKAGWFSWFSLGKTPVNKPNLSAQSSSQENNLELELFRQNKIILRQTSDETPKTGYREEILGKIATS